MKKLDETVKKETLYIAAWTLILSAVMQSVFLVIGLWKPDVLFGNLISAAAAIFNGKVFAIAGPPLSKRFLRLAEFSGTAGKRIQIIFLLALPVKKYFQLALGAVGVFFFNPIAAILPLFFPRAAIAFRPLFDKKAKETGEGE